MGQARRTDPDTSHRAARTPRQALRVRVMSLFDDGHGWTGHEVAYRLNAPLNSVTPRFAELQRAGKIVDSGARRDGQIVWRIFKEK